MTNVKSIAMKDVKFDVYASTINGYPVYNAVAEAEGIIGLGFGKDGPEAIIDALRNLREKLQKLEDLNDLRN